MYENPNVALSHGFAQAPVCVQSTDGSGALGTVLVNPSLSTKKVDLTQPQELFYDFNPSHGARQLLGVGYIERNTGQRPPATPLGHMEGPLPGVFPGEGSHYELHAWIFRRNPDGVFDFWNKDVSCA
jgi:hypothetical protein